MSRRGTIPDARAPVPWVAPPPAISERPSQAIRRRSDDRGGTFARIMAPLFNRVMIEPDVAERLRKAHAQGAVVHVLRVRRVLDPLFILHVLERLGLPQPSWMQDHYAALRPPSIGSLADALRAGEPALVFLRRPKTLTQGGAYSERYVEALLELQRELDRPILLMPEALLWTRRAGGIKRTLIDVVFGDREAPGRLREMLGFALNAEGSRFHVGAPVDLSTVLEREKDASDVVTAKKVRWALMHHLAREEAIRTGPQHRDVGRTRALILKDPAVQRVLREEEEKGADPAQLEKKANAVLKKAVADMRYGGVRLLDAILDRVFNEIFDGIIVDQEGLHRVWSAARTAPIVLVPSHKSHADYLVLSQVFFRAGMMPPHIAAGDNLSFPPLGTILRRAGAFFIRRSFSGDKVYVALMAAYVRRLLREGNAVEFFIEGGRSRTGKLLPPKMGMLSMCVSPVLDGSIHDAFFVPVSIGYEKIIEARSYARELGGGEKKKEDLGALLSTRKVLRSRYGRVYLDFDEPISLRAFAAARGFTLGARSEIADDPDRPEKRDLVSQLGHGIAYGINRITRVTPTGVAALVLLAQARPGMAEEELLARAERMMELLASTGARLSTVLAGETRHEAIKEALGRLAGDGLVKMTPAPDGATIYRIDEDGRRALDFYKNNALHLVVPHAIVALAALAPGGAGDTAVKARARRLSRLLKLEFVFRPDRDFEANFTAAAEQLAARRVLARIEGSGEEETTWTVPPRGRDAALELAGLIAVFLEAYRVVAESLGSLAGSGLAEKKLLEQIRARAQRQVLEGRMKRAEAASQATIQNAVRLFGELGMLVKREDGSLVLSEQGAIERVALISELDGFLEAAG